MHPILFSWGPDVLIPSYAVFVALAYFMGLFVWLAQSRRFNLTKNLVIHLSLVLLLSGFIGARLLYVLTQAPKYLADPAAILRIWEGGLVFFGGVIGGALALYWQMKRHRLLAAHVLDSLAPALCLAHAVGRIGCFLNGCCYGSECEFPWAVVYNDSRSAMELVGLPVHPVQIYEAVGLLLLGSYLLLRNMQVSARPRLFSSVARYAIGYGILRFGVEFYRGDALRGVMLGLSTSQWIALVFIFGGILLDFKARPFHNCAT